MGAEARDAATGLELVCPGCHGPLAARAGEVVCDAERLSFPVVGGVPLLVLPDARERVAGFLGRYLAVRHAERWTDDDRDLLLALPYEDRSGRRPEMWRVRARGLEALRRALRRELGARRLRVCERGAGVAWLSYRLALDGHEVVATDVNADARDGLGAARRYVEAGTRIVRAAAEMDCLPLRSASADAVVDAASLHYAVTRDALERAVAEAARVLAPGGLFAVVDSPVYSSHEAGERMLAEWRERLGREFGPEHAAARDSGYLVRAEIAEVLERRGFDVSFEPHWMGWRWALNYWRHRALGPREPATMPMILGRLRPRP